MQQTNGVVDTITLNVMLVLDTPKHPLFPPKASYTGLIVIKDVNGIVSELTKDFTHSDFAQMESEVEDLKKGWLESGLKPEQIIVKYIACGAS